MSRCTNVECSVPVRWSDKFGDGAWTHTGTGERKCPDDGATPPLSQRRQRPAERFWRCPECNSWNPVSEDGHGRLSAACIGPALRPHDEATWTLELRLEGVEPLPHPDLRLSPDRRLVAIRTDGKWKVSDGTQRPDSRVADWLPLPVEPTIPAPREPADDEDRLEYGVEYRYSPDRWHVLPNVIFTDPVSCAKAVQTRNKVRSAGEYRCVKRRAAGPWEALILTPV